MIRRLGNHAGNRILFGYDRYILPELDLYRESLSAAGHLVEVVDNPLHYLTSAELVCRELQGTGDVAVLCCGTGIGMSIAANKFPGIYAARCTSVDDAELARTINNANVLCLAARCGVTVNRSIIAAFVHTAYTGRKLDELEYIVEIERTTTMPAAIESQKRRAVRRTA